MIKKKDKKATKKDRYLEESKGWESDRIGASKRNEKIAWFVAGFSGLVALVAVAAVAMLTPLKTSEAFVVRVNETTGETDIVTAVQGIQSMQGREALTRYWIGRYVRLREGYFFPSVKHDYSMVMLMSASTAAKEYRQYMNPKNNPQSPVVKYRGRVEMSVDIESISFLGEHTAMIRFDKTIDPKNGPTSISSWVATLEYRFRPQRPLSLSQRRKNPFGFTVGRYRVTPSVTGGNNEGA